MMDSRTFALENENIGKLLFSYSIPAIIASTASSLYNIIDRMFIGQGVGAYAISGLALTFPIMNLSAAFGTLVGAGAASIVSIRMGEKRNHEATRVLGNAFILNIIIGIVYSVLALWFLDDMLILFGASELTLPYARDFMRVILFGNVITHLFFGLNGIMRASGYPLKAMITTIITVAANLIFAPLFIYVFGWGIKGAAWATLLSQAIGLVWVMAHFVDKTSTIRFVRGCFALNRKIIADIFSIGMSPFLIHACSCLITIVMNRQLKAYGGDLAVGAFGIINSIVGLVVMVVFGFTQGMQPVVGYNYGARKPQRVTKTLKLTVLCASVVAVSGFLLAMFFPRHIAQFFTTDTTLISLTAYGIRIYMMMIPIVGFQIVTSNFFQSIGKAELAIVLSLSRQVLFIIPFLFVLPQFFSLTGVWAAQPAADLLAAVVTAVTLTLFYRKSPLFNSQLQ
ncbi:MAG: MATE family efflux transporter [Bacteroidales bacterium]|nr:MATE family efflux transporter [Bacteroidales bacterium]